MNHGIYRLVFNVERNAWVAVAECVRGRGKKSARKRVAAVVLGVAASFAVLDGAWAAPSLPPVLATALPVPSTSRPFVFAGAAAMPTTVGSAMTINTASRTLGLNWDSFNIGRSASVTFNQPDASSRVLNRIWDNNPTQILGQLTANGQIYLINQNGILFGNGAQVNVGGLVASALGMSDTMMNRLMNNGLPTTKGDSLEFAWTGTAAGFEAGFVLVDAGAKITTPTGGKVVLIAPKTVENLGLIESGGGGEAILAAGGKVILTAPDDPNLRGVLVETQSFVVRDALGNSVALDGSVTNNKVTDGDGVVHRGRIDMGRDGVVSLAALAVNQKGLVNATKAVNLNGTTMLVDGSIDTDRLTINQRGSVAEIDWASGFDVAAGKTVEFVQSSAGSVAYNYVYDPDRTAADGLSLNRAGRSYIDGTLQANGQVFLINEKGIRFGDKAQVTASSFVGTALGMNQSVVSNGLLAQDVGERAFFLSGASQSAANSGEFDTKSASLKADMAAAAIQVDKGARISMSADNGFLLLFGNTILQGGELSAKNGQALLAAGSDVYLKAPFSAGLRGFMAEVSPMYLRMAWLGDQSALLGRGSIVNTGSIFAAKGNISLTAFDITQAGLLQASTSATANGSIRLMARDTAVSTGQRKVGTSGVTPYVEDESYSADDAVDPNFRVGTEGGMLRFTSGSVTEVVIDGSNGKTIASDQVFISSTIEGAAKKIVIEGNQGDATGAALVAHGGNISLVASDLFSVSSAFAGDPILVPQTDSPQSDVGVFAGSGSRLDVSGVTASKSVADLFIEVELRGDEFADNPVQRSGKLRGEKAWVDIRDKVSIADLSGWVKKVGQTVEEKTSTGGAISLRSTGSVIVKDDAVLDVSGGRVDYAAGKVNESRVVTVQGQVYRLNDAPSSASYAGITTVTRDVQAYREGKSAGSVEVVGNSLAVDGKLLASTTIGTKQRELGDPASNGYAIPLGGRLIVKDAGQHYVLADAQNATEAEKIAAFSEAQIRFVRGAAQAAAGLSETDGAGQRLELSENLVTNGFSRFDITSDGRIEVPADVSLVLSPGGSFMAAGRQVYVAGDIDVPSGTVSLTTRDMSREAGSTFPGESDDQFSNLIIDGSSRISTAGRWVNDFLDGRDSTVAKAINGGSVTLTSAHDLDLREGSVIDVSGGGLVKTDGSLTSGNAGSVALSTGGFGKGANFEIVDDAGHRDSTLFMDGEIRGYALGKGGSLSIQTSAVSIGEVSDVDTRDWSRQDRLDSKLVGVDLSEAFFGQGGFYSFDIFGREGVRVVDEASITVAPMNWSLFNVTNYRYRPSGSDLAGFAPSVILHSDLRSAPTSLSLSTGSTLYGDLKIGEGAYLGVSPKGSINLQSAKQLTVLGTLEALAGTINLSRPLNRANDPYNGDSSSHAYTEGRQSESIFLGEKSQLLAGGTVVLSGATRRAVEGGVSIDSLRNQVQYRGEVLAGGVVNIDAGLGYVVTASGSTIDVSGAEHALNTPTASGNGGLGYPLRMLGSSGGRVNIAAREGMFLDGSYLASGKQGALGGVFSLQFYELASNESWDTEILPDYMSAPRQLSLYQSGSSVHVPKWVFNKADTDTYLAGGKTLKESNGDAALDLTLLANGGFGSWYLSSRDDILFSGAIDATVDQQLRLSAARFEAIKDTPSVIFKSAALQLGNQASSGAPVQVATTGKASASFTARDIGVVGTFSWNGFATTNFDSRGEIHFDSVANTAPNRTGGRDFSGQMTGAGKVTFAAARLSPSTYSDYRIDFTSDPLASITIARSANSSVGTSLSAGGRLEFAAPAIEHGGVIGAPMGEIVFNAAGGKVTLLEESETSVAADGSLLFGQTIQSGRYWQFTSSYWSPETKSVVSTTYEVDSIPEKAIRIEGSDTEVRSGAKLDLSGGGALLAAEWSSGPGGKADILEALETAEPTVFAVLPGWSGKYAPQDAEAMAYYNVSRPLAYKVGTSESMRYDPIPSLMAGDQVQIAANGSGLAAGSYTLLPARYALLPGAFLVTVKPTSNTVTAQSKVQADGSWLVAGTRLAANENGSYSSYSQTPLTVELASPNVVGSRARYQISSASDFFFDSVGAKLPDDAGRLTVVGRNRVVFDPSVEARRQVEIITTDGQRRATHGLELDIAAPKLLVTDAPSVAEDDWSVIDQNKLNKLGASSLLIGAVRSNDGESLNIETVATDVIVHNSEDASTGSALLASEVMVAAKENLEIAGGSRIESTGSATGGGTLSMEGDGAFLRVAEGGQAEVVRTGSVSSLTGKITIASGASLVGESIVIDSTFKTSVDGTLTIGALQKEDGSRIGGNLAIGAKKINVVGSNVVTPPSDGLTLGASLTQYFNSLNQLRLTSYQTVDFYGSASLGASSLGELVISSAGLRGHGEATDTATIDAKRVVFRNPNSSSASFSGISEEPGQLVVTASQINFEANVKDQSKRTAEQTGFAIRGFGTSTFTGTEEIRFSGLGVTTIGDQSDATSKMILDAGRVVTGGSADHLVRVQGNLEIKGGSNAAVASDLGGSLAFKARDDLTVSGKIDLPAGQLALTAEKGDLTVKAGAKIRADGYAKSFADTVAYAPAGKVDLNAGEGDISIAKGALISVSAVGQGDAGQLSLAAQKGTVSVGENTLAGAASSTSDSARKAELLVDASSVSLDDLVDAVAGGGTTSFSGGWDVRLRTGDLKLSQGKTIKSEQVLLAADAGAASISGTIDASGKKGGTIEIYSRGGNVELTQSGRLLANGTELVANASNAGTRGEGGKVVLGTAGGNKVVTTAESQIDVGTAVLKAEDGSVLATSAARRGSVTFRAGEADAANGVANLALGGEIYGAADVVAEIVSTYEGNSLTAGTSNKTTKAVGMKTVFDELAGKYSSDNVKKLRSTLSFNDTTETRYHIRPGVEISTPGGSTSDFTVSDDLNFSSFRFADASGNLTEPGTLTIRSAKSLKVNKSISDGFVAVTAESIAPTGMERDAMVAASGDSWSYRLVAGADSAAANLRAVNPASSTANLQLAANKLIRTGTGNIELAAAGNITLASGAAIYTAGTDGPAVNGNFAQLFAEDDVLTGSRAHYTTGGGDILVKAMGNISQAATTPISDWLVRYSSGPGSTQWFGRLASFRQGFGAFGGGDVALTAGGSVIGVTAVVPTNGRIPEVNGEARTELAVIQGGGDLSVNAGQVVSGGQFYAESGLLRMNAGKSIGYTDANKAAAPSVGLGNTEVLISAFQDVNLGNVSNPLAINRNKLAYKDSSGKAIDGGTFSDDNLKARIGTFSDTSRLDVLAVRGSILLGGSADADSNLAPGQVGVAALNGDISGRLNQNPGTNGQLDLLAGGSIKLDGIVQYDLPADAVPSVDHPVLYGTQSPYALTNPLLVHSKTPWHASDSEHSRLIALNGDITGPGSKDAVLQFNEPVFIQASGNIEKGVSVVSQHLGVDDVTRIEAGGSIKFRDVATAKTVFQVDGPGRLEVIAGEDVDLAAGLGIVTKGNFENPYLPEGGANVLVLAGTTQPDYSEFQQYLQENGLYSAQDSGESALRDRFFTLLRDYGNEAEAGGGEASYAKGRTLIQTLFPNSLINEGNIDFFYSAIKTEQGGTIDLLAPGGGITVGIANPSTTLGSKGASEQGLFTLQGGQIRALAHGNFLVNQSRVFTLDGGDILAWADYGNIDAGSGAKTVSATPPPVLVVRGGQIVLDASNSVSGSGIGALASKDDTPASNVYLFAPQGAIDAGDAGLRSTGNITLGARVILNASNIQAAGAVTGAPAAAATAAPVAAVTSPTNSENQALEDAAPGAGRREGSGGMLTVEVLDGGPEAVPDCPSGKGDDGKCKPRTTG